jgi:hypothetical protein
LLAAACLAATDSTYPRSIRRELFYTDIEKRSAQGNEYRGASPEVPCRPKRPRLCATEKSRIMPVETQVVVSPLKGRFQHGTVARRFSSPVSSQIHDG